MIYTVTFNPAVDYVVHAGSIKTGEINALDSENIFFGGKGINVSFVLKRLGIGSKALGFIGGFTGDAIEAAVRANGIETDFVRLENGFSRINVKIRAGNETDLNAKGPYINEADVLRFYEKLSSVKNGDTVILAGSIPPSLPSDIYESILARLSDRSIRAVVDARGKLLLNVLKYNPFLIKPNADELGEIFGIRTEDPDSIIFHALRLKEMGAVNVLVSMGERGAILIDENEEIHRCGVCCGKAVNTVGAGDSMIAGFIAGMSFSRGDYKYALRLGTAAGGATAFSEGLGSGEAILELFEKTCEA